MITDELKLVNSNVSYIKRLRGSIWLARWDDFRTANWVEIVEYPELVFQQSQQLLAL